MEITLVEFTQQEQQEKSDQIEKETGHKPTEVQLYQALRRETMSVFPHLEVKEIARTKNTQTLIFVLLRATTKII